MSQSGRDDLSDRHCSRWYMEILAALRGRGRRYICRWCWRRRDARFWQRIWIAPQFLVQLLGDRISRREFQVFTELLLGLLFVPHHHVVNGHQETSVGGLRILFDKVDQRLQMA